MATYAELHQRAVALLLTAAYTTDDERAVLISRQHARILVLMQRHIAYALLAQLTDAEERKRAMDIDDPAIELED